MTHLPFVAAAYALGTAVPLFFTLQVFWRLRAAESRLNAIDPRRNRRNL
jgi:hypothetical protein